MKLHPFDTISPPHEKELPFTKKKKKRIQYMKIKLIPKVKQKGFEYFSHLLFSAKCLPLTIPFEN